jgi:predicted nucleotidyltransferase
MQYQFLLSNLAKSHCFRYQGNAILGKAIFTVVQKYRQECLHAHDKYLTEILSADFRKIDAWVERVTGANNTWSEDIGGMKYEAWRYARFGVSGNNYPVKYVFNLEELLQVDDVNRVFVYIEDVKPAFESLEHSVKGDYEGYIEAQLDLSGINALVREGLVKRMLLSDGISVVAKKNNPNKEGRFLNEQKNIRILKDRLGLYTVEDIFTLAKAKGKQIEISLISPVAVIRFANNKGFCSISYDQQYPTLEEVLVECTCQKERLRHLNNCKEILELLYTKGVVWGDMAPRNILVCEKEKSTRYFILDFEKTSFTDGLVPYETRLTHARGPMYVEEFGAIFTFEEIRLCFGEYFAPETWNITSRDKLDSGQNKREVLSILRERGIVNPTVGDYNKLELDILAVRFPFIDSQGCLQRPLYSSFKVDHYLGNEYDLRLTEIFISCAKIKMLDVVLSWAESVLENHENILLLGKILWDKSVFEERKKGSEKLIRESIDKLYQIKDFSNEFYHEIKNIQVINKFYQNRTAKYDSHDHVGELNSRVLDNMLVDVVHSLPEAFWEECEIFLAGSYGRRQVTVNSDLDIAIICDSEEVYKKSRDTFLEVWRSKWNMPVEIFPYFNIAHLDEAINQDPELFFELKTGRFWAGKSKKIHEYDAKIQGVLLNDDVRNLALNALSNFSHEHGSRAISAIYGGDKRDKATPGAEGFPKPYRGIPGLQDGVTQKMPSLLKQLSYTKSLAVESFSEVESQEISVLITEKNEIEFQNNGFFSFAESYLF